MLWFGFAVAGATLNEHKVVVVDRGENAFLVRSDYPVDEQDQFQYERLVEILNSKYQLGLTAPQVVVVNLMNDILPRERKIRRIIREYFEVNPSRGRFVAWPIVCTLTALSPRMLPGPLVNLLTLVDYSWDKLESLVTMLHQEVQGWKGPGQKVVLFQCIAGADRTGSVSMAYWMKHKGMSLAQAAQQNERIIRRQIRPNCLWAAEWYAAAMKK